MNPTPEDLYRQLCQHVRETALLASLEELAGWDERTYLPTAASAFRADQMTLLAGMVHRRRTAPQSGEWLESWRTAPWPRIRTVTSGQRYGNCDAITRSGRDFPRRLSYNWCMPRRWANMPGCRPGRAINTPCSSRTWSRSSG